MKYLNGNKNFGELNGETLIKFNQKEKNLLWARGGVPAFNKEMIDKWATKIKKIYVRTEKRVFKIDFKDFLDHVEVIQFVEPQYVTDISFWEVTNH